MCDFNVIRINMLNNMHNNHCHCISSKHIYHIYMWRPMSQTNNIKYFMFENMVWTFFVLSYLSNDKYMYKIPTTATPITFNFVYNVYINMIDCL